MGEIKLVNKNATKSEIKVRDFFVKKIKEEAIFNLCRQETIQEYDFDKDGKLNTAEYHQVGRETQIYVHSFLTLTTGNGAGGN